MQGGGLQRLLLVKGDAGGVVQSIDVVTGEGEWRSSGCHDG